MQTLNVIARPGHLVADDLAYQGGARFRFVGRAIVPVKTAQPENLETRFPPAPREYPDDGAHRYVRRAIQKGALVPLDEYTAKAAGVKLDAAKADELKKPAPEKTKAPKAATHAEKDGGK